MAIFTVEKLASLCRVDRETVRRWRNRGLNGVKLQATDGEQQRGVSLMFDGDAVRAFMEANPKYLTEELSMILNGDFPMSHSAASVSEPRTATQEDNYAYRILEKQREELLRKLQDVERALQHLK